MSGSRRKTRDDVGMNLFPFLAVLICTVGSLIMLLVVMVQQARVRSQEPPTAVTETVYVDLAEQAARKQQRVERERAFHEAKTLAEAKQQEIDGFKWQTSMLNQSYEQTVRQLSEKRLALSHLESHTRELSEQASRMQSEADMIASAAQLESQRREDGRQDLEQLNAQIASASDELKELRDQVASQPPKYMLIPYDGPHGTNRPPIYIECLADRVIMQPENVVLIGDDFRAPLTTDNPLAVALRAKREFMLDQGLLPADAEPYPLLIVRPGAAASYAAARSAMAAWDAEFGYELVEKDLELDYQIADPRLSRLLSDVIIEARGRRQMMRAVRSRPRQRELLRPSSTGGFETVQYGSSSYAQAGTSGTGNEGVNGFGDGGSSDPAPFGSGAGEAAESASNDARPGGEGSGKGQSSSSSSGESATGGELTTEDFTAGPGGPRANRFESGQGAAGHSNADGPGGDSNTGVAGARGSGGVGGPSTTASGSGGNGASGSGGSARQSSNASSNNASSNNASSKAAAFGADESLAEHRGNNWALPNLQTGAVGIKRPIYVLSERQRLILVPEKGTRQELQIFRHDGSIPAVIDPFVDAVQARLQSWGIAGQGIYWRPVLQIRVHDDASENYQQLLQLLDNSGIEVIREP